MNEEVKYDYESMILFNFARAYCLTSSARIILRFYLIARIQEGD